MDVKTKGRTAYHHGDLPAVLISKTEELLEERGVEGFSLREVARRADVAAAAPSHHFGNATGLLTAVAIESFRNLAASFEAVADKGLPPRDHLVELCQAYVAHHETHKGGASVMFKWEHLDGDNPELSKECGRAFEGLKSAVRLNVSDQPEEDIEPLAKVIWASMHGIVSLRLTDPQDPTGLVRLAALSMINSYK